MSRQEFAVVADNYIHYLGYTTEDPTVLDNIAYGDQKFVAPWAQDAVRELAYLGFTNYAPGTLFNPEKYVTRAEAAEIGVPHDTNRTSTCLPQYIVQATSRKQNS